MTTLLILLTALCPALVLLWYIYRKDSAQPEPLKMLLKGLIFGALSCFVSLCFTTGAGALGVIVDEDGTVLGNCLSAFCGAALPEEVAKLLMLWLLLRKNKYFDEYLDGIVYAACIGLGFAGLENVFYLMDEPDWVSLGITRGLLTVPMHFACACAMGYYYSLHHFGHRTWQVRVKILAVPVLLHWVWDAALFSISAQPLIALVVIPLLCWFVWRLFKSTKKRIAQLKGKDAEMAQNAEMAQASALANAADAASNDSEKNNNNNNNISELPKNNLLNPY